MVNKPHKQSQEQEEEAESRSADKNTTVTLPKGGMSPLADRKDPEGWEKSVDAEPATGKREEASKAAPHATPAEPVGGWVDGSTGRGKILVPKPEESGAPRRGPTDERTPMRLIKAKDTDAFAALPPAESLARRLHEKEAREKKATAEAGATERQEEDRNEQDAVREDEEDAEDDEEDEEGEQNRSMM